MLSEVADVRAFRLLGFRPFTDLIGISQTLDSVVSVVQGSWMS